MAAPAAVTVAESDGHVSGGLRTLTLAAQQMQAGELGTRVRVCGAGRRRTT